MRMTVGFRYNLLFKLTIITLCKLCISQIGEGLSTNTLEKDGLEDDNELDSTIPSQFVKSKWLPNKCEGGKVYRIQSVEDLHENEPELECIFLSAVAPTKVPEGAMIGDALDLSDSRFLNPAIRALWTGKFIEKIDCNGTELYRGWNHFTGHPHFQFMSVRGKIADKVKLHPLEPEDTKGVIFIDYSTDVEDLCPQFPSIARQNPHKFTITKSSRNKNFFPLNQVTDVIRLVGKQADGGNIYLGKVLGKVGFKSTQFSEVIGFFSLVNYDQDVNPDFKIGQALPPLERDMFFRRGSFLDLMWIIFPYHNLLLEPMHAAKELGKQFIITCHGALNFAIDVCFGSSEESRKFNDQFLQVLPPSPIKTRAEPFLMSNNMGHLHYTDL